jgi:hypothetical protein
MAKTKISQYSQTASNNTDLNGISCAEGMAPSDVNNWMRELMSQVKDFQVGAEGDPLTVAGTFVAQGRADIGGALNVTGATALTGTLTVAAGIVANITGNVTGTAANVTGTVAVANGGTGLTSPSTSGNVLTSDGTAWTSAAPVSSAVTKEVTSTSDLSLTDWTSGLLPTSISNIGSSFSVVIPTSGVIKLNITLRLQNGAANFAQSYFGIRIGSTNYMFGYILDNVPDAIDYTGNLSTFSEDTNDYINYYGESNSISFFGLGNSLGIDIIGQSVPTGTQTVQLFAAGQDTAIIKGTALTTRALIQFIGVN